ncbi:MAG TPA: hypothetical protein VL201_04165 [Patescibacteria group bacterium]|jgi:hypothetical protein|nr:hypothetical protein [Patescibacteria group bacterium]
MVLLLCFLLHGTMLCTDENQSQNKQLSDTVYSPTIHNAPDEPQEEKVKTNKDKVASDRFIEKKQISVIEKKEVAKSDENNTEKKTVSATSIEETLKTKKITVTNTIKPENIAYKHWSGIYKPEFTVTVQGKEVNMSCTEVIELRATSMSISYHAQFPVQHSSQDSLIVHLENDTKKVAIDFDWHSEPRLKITQSS